MPAVSGGALTVLNQHYHDAKKDRKNNYIFVVSLPSLKEEENIIVLNYTWVKKSWFHRLYFDNIVAPNLVKSSDSDEVLSLQNIIIPRVEKFQTLYLHQSLPFVEKRFKITENLKMWLYQNIIGRMIFSSIKKADKVIVQSKWMQEAAVNKTNTEREKFVIRQPKLHMAIKQKYEKPEGKLIFFYPAGASPYKNHEIIVETCRLLKKEDIVSYKIIFTLRGNENKHIIELFKIIKEEKLPIFFVGNLSLDEVYVYYSKSILLFPSYIETFGLPLLEAREHGCPIIASDCAFSREILEKYPRAVFFDPFNFLQLRNHLINVINDV